ncbi:hypothetical protein PPL_05268 [Heterostelium album PN500]|uniref:ditrans,polycis-polyprenyl diphosphate synthase [(2E,6E)-farnesyldiphosphate specific] n=1 Tax=Heterostelium pallidum (strain ATCC 26659 / Pp 5 / PN500) TaxID=670386 RepID=D3BB82_HETP5|nr:hypothetical protein PPL_05268 [Heterostelium album PN500]EFA81289.1 hypothetical protein PPL_05268 [Heterostelium album PN500]|eukprot:XP_020433407.1 hypothetical protein PPL_05268 [Heterostelium album PN500]
MESFSECIYYCVYCIAFNTFSLILRSYDLMVMIRARCIYLLYSFVYTLMGVLGGVSSDRFSCDHILSRMSAECFDVPHHLAVIIDINHADFSKIVDILAWSVIAGIQRITIFENTGILKQHIDTIQSMLEQRKLTSKSTTSSTKQQNEIYTYHWLNKLTSTTNNNNSNTKTTDNNKPFEISIVSNEDGKMELVNITKKYTIDRKSNSSLQLDSNYIQANLPIHIGGADNEPQIAMDFTERNILNGFLPWHIKLTEFIKVDNFNQLYLDKYLNILKSYGRIEKRLGK